MIEKHQCVVARHVSPTGTWPTTQACALDWELNWRPFGSQAGTQSSEPGQIGAKYFQNEPTTQNLDLSKLLVGV